MMSNNKYNRQSENKAINPSHLEVLKINKLDNGIKASNEVFENNTTYYNCDVSWTQWESWLGDIPGSATKVEYSGATITISKTGKMAKIEVFNDDRQLKVFNKRLATKDFYFEEVKTN